TLETALAESIHRRAQELAEIGAVETRLEMRLYTADFRASFHDIRPRRTVFATLYDPVTYDASQRLGRDLLEAGSNGVVYRSVRQPDGECLACFRPKLVRNVRVAGHYEYHWEGTGAPRVRRI